MIVFGHGRTRLSHPRSWIMVAKTPPEVGVREVVEHAVQAQRAHGRPPSLLTGCTVARGLDRTSCRDPQLAVAAPRRAWLALYYWSLMVVLAMPCAIRIAQSNRGEECRHDCAYRDEFGPLDANDPQHRRGRPGHVRRAVCCDHRDVTGRAAFTASPEEARAFYLNSTAGWVQAAMAVAGLAAIGWIWFVVGLCLLLGRAEGSPPWRSAVALVSGVILAAHLLLNTSGNAASFGAADLIWQWPTTPSMSALLGWPTSGSRWAVLRCAPAGWCCPLASSVVGLAGGPSPGARARNLPFLLDIGSLALCLTSPSGSG